MGMLSLNLDALGPQIRDDDVDAALLDRAQAARGHAQAHEALLGFQPESGLCKLGRKRRRLRLFACDTVFPVFGRLPVTWQTRDMA